MDEDNQDEPYEIEGVDGVPAAELHSGTLSVSGLETPESIDLRKAQQVKEPYNGPPRQLYQELKMEDAAVGSELFGSQHRYVIPQDERLALVRGNLGKSDRMEVSLDPNDLMEVEEGITEDLIRKRYDDTLQLEKTAHRKEDLSDLVATEAAKRRRKEKKKEFRF